MRCDRWVEWSDDDPAVARMRAALALRPPEPAGAAETAEAEAEAVITRRERVSGLLARVRAGDRAAADVLRRLLDK